jgi:lipopolysaccharide export system protein LptA
VKRLVALFVALPWLATLAVSTSAQQLDMSHGGPISVSATDGIEWRQAEKQVIARGNARAIRGNVTVTGDRLIAFYRPKNGTTPTPAPKPAQPSQTGINDDADSGGNEIFRVEAEGNVHIYTQTDQAQGDKAIYDLDQAVMVLTGHDLKLTTPNEILTARDSLEYYAQKHMAVARGNAVVVTNDGRRVAADTLVAYTTDAPSTPPGAATQVAAKPGNPDDAMASSGKLQKVEAFGNVSVRTATDIATGDRAVYVPDTGIARLAGHVHITRGQNQLDGAEADVDMKTGISRLVPGTGSSARVQGLVVPNDASTGQALPGQAPAKPATAGAK